MISLMVTYLISVRLAERQPIVLGTYTDNICLMAPRHALWLTGLDADGLLQIQNPWASEPLRTYTLKDFRSQVLGLTISASYKTKAGLYPPLSEMSTHRNHIDDNCRGYSWMVAIGSFTIASLIVSFVVTSDYLSCVSLFQ